MSSPTEALVSRRLDRAIVAEPLSILGLDTMILRVAADDTILYANTSLARFLDTDKDELIGQSINILCRYFSTPTVQSMSAAGEVHEAIRVIQDTHGRNYELKVSTHGSVRDVVIHDISDRQHFQAYVRRYLPPGLEETNDEDLSTFKFPERRFMSVSFTDLRGFTALSETLSPEEIREMINAYLEEVIGAVHDNHASVDKIIGDEVMVLYGAPRYYRDHALRAIKTASAQMSRLRLLQTRFQRMGRPMPDCGIGINSGEMVVGNIGVATRQDYTVLGSSVNLASRLCSVAGPGEILLTEATLHAALPNLPEHWEILEARAEENLPLPNPEGKALEMLELPPELERKVIAIGPDMNGDPTARSISSSIIICCAPKASRPPSPSSPCSRRTKATPLSVSTIRRSYKSPAEKFLENTVFNFFSDAAAWAKSGRPMTPSATPSPSKCC
ncbi:MAG: hypothetical protein HC904_12250 [Blastochloris sp.]|nr:hypothetical protein [Blastochloris sp.]